MYAQFNNGYRGHSFFFESAVVSFDASMGSGCGEVLEELLKGQVAFVSVTAVLSSVFFSAFSTGFHGFQNFITIGWMKRCHMYSSTGMIMQGTQTIILQSDLSTKWPNKWNIRYSEPEITDNQTSTLL